MADNTVIDAGSGGDTIATDDIGGVKYQRVKISQGADGSATDVGIGGGTEATAFRVTVASDSTGVLSVDDNGSTLSVDDGGGALTVDGTVTANLSATDNAVLDSIDAAVNGTLTVDGSGVTQPISHAALTELAGAIDTEVQVDIVSSALPTGAATSAKQDTIIGHVDGIEGLLTTIDADTSNLSVVGGGTEATAQRVTIANDSTGVLSVDDNGGSLTVDGSVTANAGTNLNTSALALESGGNLAGAATSLAVIDDWDESDRAKVNPIVGQAGVQGGSGAVSNTTQRVVLATDVALPAGTNGIGKLTANSGVDIGDVDVTSVIPGTGATNLGKAIDTAIGATDTVVVAGAVRDDALTTLTPADNDVTVLRVNSTGALWVDRSGTQPVSGTVTANQGTAGTAWEVVGDVAQDAAIAGNPLPTGFRASAALPTAMSADGDSVYGWSDLRGRVVTKQQAGAATLTNVNDTASSTTLLSANTSRVHAKIHNDSTEVLLIKYGATASATSFTARLAPQGYYEVDDGYTGIIDGIWLNDGSGAARMTELAA